ncbi:MAG: electron transfer flavoprotein subunit beta/FixA family protein [Thermodesulfobacteriota bacterium]
MNILVCLKQVCEPETAFSFQASPPRLRLPDAARYQMNSFDEYALEEALLLKERLAGVRLDALSVGPVRVAAVLQRAQGMGADRAVHVLSEQDSEALSVATWIAAWAREQDYDLILCGAMSQDAMQGLVGPLLAELLGLPLATLVVKLEPRPAQRMYVEREVEGGWRDCLELPFPALLTIQSGINRPRYPSLSNLLRAKQTRPFAIEASTLPTATSRLELVAENTPQRTRTGLRLQGSTQDKARQLAAMLRERALL